MTQYAALAFGRIMKNLLSVFLTVQYSRISMVLFHKKKLFMNYSSCHMNHVGKLVKSVKVLPLNPDLSIGKNIGKYDMFDRSPRKTDPSSRFSRLFGLLKPIMSKTV